MFLELETCGQTRKHCFRNKNFLNLSGNIFASQEANFVSATMFPGVGKQGNMDRKLNVSATMFPSLPRALMPCNDRIVYQIEAIEKLHSL